MSVRPWRTFLMVSIGVFASLLDLFIVNIAFPDLQQDFPRTGLSELSWVLNGYGIIFAALLTPAGRVADLYGRKRGFIAGLLTFTVASAACALAPSVPFLIAARIVQGIGAAVLIPSSLGVVLPEFEAAKRPVAIAAWAAVGAVGAAAGPPLGGLLVQLSWRWVFLVNLPLGLVSVAYAWLRLRESRDADSPGFPDVLGTAALTLGIGALTLALVQGRDWGWSSGRVLTAFVVAAAGLAFALLRSARHRAPALELPMLRLPAFALAVTSALAFFAAFAAMLLASVLYLTRVWGESILLSGFQLAAGPLAALIFSIVASRVGPRVGMGTLGGVGGLLVAAGLAWNAVRLGSVPDYVGAFLPGQLITGAGVGLTMPAFTAVAVSAAGTARYSTAVGISAMFRQVGGALGVAAFVALVGSPARSQAPQAFRHGWIFMVLAAGLGAVLMLATRFVHNRPAAPDQPIAAAPRAGASAVPVGE